MFLTKDIGIDLGTANVVIHVKGKGIVLDEPSVVAIDKATGKIHAVGTEAHQMVGRTPGNIVAIRPLRDGVIADFEMTEAMLRHFIDKIEVRSMFGGVRMLICTPASITTVEAKAIRQAGEKSGAKTVFLEVEPKVAAVGAGMDIWMPAGHMVIDIGGGTTDVAVLSMGDIVCGETIKVAGDRFDHDIIRAIKDNHKLIIGERTAQNVKMTVATVSDEGRQEEMDIRGRNLVTGLPDNITISSQEMHEALAEAAMEIVEATKRVLEKTPPELAADIIDRGIILTGGGALLDGIDQLLAKELGLPVLIAEDPMLCVARGTGIMLDHLGK
ncbi:MULTISPECIES: rod shape-determining protein MreB [unclassified Exiguobacterium]|uniref:rod shape-determining protein MreB n=1 Tax=unclassified Exiguobacterium TaxID=2644629 RepID=UPI001BECC65F|nr:MULTISPECIES: rod shape-determining protein MreB [unclassified Exiguobacterium]MCK2156133.1 rod shape-determining protein MreB [Exiguobacterium sp. 17-1]